jgi:L-lactate dehydrogenase complex protein LldG
VDEKACASAYARVKFQGLVGAQTVSPAREVILNAIRAAIDAPRRTAVDPPRFPSLFALPASSEEQLAAAFSAEVSALGGTVAIVDDESACAGAIGAYLQRRGLGSVMVQASPLAAAIGSLLRGCEVSEVKQHPSSDTERADCGLVEATALLADTGSAIVLATQRQDRLLPYLPRTCVVVSAMNRLHPSLSTDAMASVNEAARQGVRGEAVIITGPSRTADIEKTLVLGAHGPADLAIFILQKTEM